MVGDREDHSAMISARSPARSSIEPHRILPAQRKFSCE
jgi:hypothetical protein